MKTIKLLGMLLLLPIILFSQNSNNPKHNGKRPVVITKGQYSIAGDIKGLTVEKLYLSMGPKPQDSALVYDGHFVFKGSLNFPSYCMIESNDHSFVKQFWLENSPINLSGSVGSEIRVSGSKTENEYSLFNTYTTVDEIRNKVSVKKSEIKAALDAGNQTAIDRLEKEKQALVAEWNAKGEQFVREHPDSYVSLNQVYNRAEIDKVDFEELSRLFNYVSEKLRNNSDQGKILIERIKALKLTTVGQTFPDFTQPDANGNLVKISDYKGKYVLLTFSGSWNKPYREEHHMKIKLYNKYHEKGFDVLDVLFEGKKESLIKITEEDKMPWKVVSDLKGWNNEAVKRFAIESIPQNCLIDPNGVIIVKNIYGEALEKKLSEIFK